MYWDEQYFSRRSRRGQQHKHLERLSRLSFPSPFFAPHSSRTNIPFHLLLQYAPRIIVAKEMQRKAKALPFTTANVVVTFSTHFFIVTGTGSPSLGWVDQRWRCVAPPFPFPPFPSPPSSFLAPLSLSLGAFFALTRYVLISKLWRDTKEPQFVRISLWINKKGKKGSLTDRKEESTHHMTMAMRLGEPRCRALTSVSSPMHGMACVGQGRAKKYRDEGRQ